MTIEEEIKKMQSPGPSWGTQNLALEIINLKARCTILENALIELMETIKVLITKIKEHKNAEAQRPLHSEGPLESNLPC